MMTAAEFLKNVQSESVEPLYLLTGEEAYLQRECLNALIAALLPDESLQMFNYSQRSVAAESLDAALCDANQFPMMAKRRLVVARDFDKVSDAEIEALKDYLRRPNPTTTLVFQTATLDKRRTVTTVLLKGCTQVECARLTDQQATQWAQHYARRRGYEFAPPALGQLIGLAGTELFTLSNEIEKLMTSVGSGGTITPDAIAALTVRSRQFDSFALSDAVVAGDAKQALRILHRLLDQGQEPVALVGLLAWAYRQMLMAADLMAVNAPRDEIARELRMPPSRLTNFLTAVRRKSESEIRRGITRLAEIDAAIKSSQATPRLHLEIFLCDLLAR
jgi:DNA polymerase-3 subunit delta